MFHSKRDKKAKDEKTGGHEKGSKLPDNAPLLVDRLKPSQMQSLILKKMQDHTPIVVDDILALLENAEMGKKHLGHGEVEPEEVPSQPGPNLQRLTTASRIELETDFAQFDKNGDGNISLDEFIQIMHRTVPGHEAPQFEDAELVALFQQMDQDGGGTVDYHEFAEQWAIDRAHEEMHDEVHA